MPVTSGKYQNNETEVFRFLTTEMGFNTAVACGVMANIERESMFGHDKIEAGYTFADGGFGICQWTNTPRGSTTGRRSNLVNWCTSNGFNYNSLIGQLNYLKYELYSDKFHYYKKVTQELLKEPNTAVGAYNAGYLFCYRFEVPAGYNTGVSNQRGAMARDKYWAYYSNIENTVGLSHMTQNIGKTVVEIAKQQVGKPYVLGANGPDKFDCSGLVYYCYNQAGYRLNDQTADSYYNSFKSKGVSVSPSATAPGDLLFYENNSSHPGLDHIAIADGNGGRIHARSPEYGVVYDRSGLGSPKYILRILSGVQTSTPLAGFSTPVGGNAVGTATLSSVDPHTSSVAQNLSRVEKRGYDSGYLIDMTHGGEFKFYVPEFSESAGANWNPVDIRGRSVSILSYESTSSRTISISLELYAGVGLYTAVSGESGEEIVSRMHNDLNFVKSLEYPDYTTAITQPPSTVHLILGAAVDIIGVVKNVSVEHLKPVDRYNRSMYVKLSFEVVQTAVNPPSYTDIRQGQRAIAGTDDVASIVSGGTTAESALARSVSSSVSRTSATNRVKEGL